MFLLFLHISLGFERRTFCHLFTLEISSKLISCLSPSYMRSGRSFTIQHRRTRSFPPPSLFPPVTSAWNGLPSAWLDHPPFKVRLWITTSVKPSLTPLVSLVSHLGACLQLSPAITESLAFNYMLSTAVCCWLP